MRPTAKSAPQRLKLLSAGIAATVYFAAGRAGIALARVFLAFFIFVFARPVYGKHFTHAGTPRAIRTGLLPFRAIIHSGYARRAFLDLTVRAGAIIVDNVVAVIVFPVAYLCLRKYSVLTVSPHAVCPAKLRSGLAYTDTVLVDRSTRFRLACKALALVRHIRVIVVTVVAFRAGFSFFIEAISIGIYTNRDAILCLINTIPVGSAKTTAAAASACAIYLLAYCDIELSIDRNGSDKSPKWDIRVTMYYSSTVIFSWNH